MKDKILLSQEDIKDELLIMLCNFKDYCEKHNLSFFISSGTLLGAIRHQDFIPWDDDIDVFMPRPDYEKLIKQIEIESINDYYIFKKWGDKDYQFPFCKVLNTKIDIYEENSLASDFLWIDIFPIDGLPDDEIESANHLNNIFSNRKPLTRSIARIGKGRNKFRAILKLPFLIIPKIKGYAYYAQKMNDLALKYDYDKSNYVGLAVWPYGDCERMKKEELFPPVEVLFRGEKFKTIACYDKYLKNLYGDYMKLPPENKRLNHQMIAYKIIDQ